jgi:hypothetical protein
MISIEHIVLVNALRGDLARSGVCRWFFRRHGFNREFTETTTLGRSRPILNEGLSADELARLTSEGSNLTAEAAIALAEP